MSNGRSFGGFGDPGFPLPNDGEIARRALRRAGSLEYIRKALAQKNWELVNAEIGRNQQGLAWIITAFDPRRTVVTKTLSVTPELDPHSVDVLDGCVLDFLGHQ